MSQVRPNSPAFHAGLEKGDFLVTFEDDLVLFLSWQDIEAKMKALGGSGWEAEINVMAEENKTMEATIWTRLDACSNP